MLTLTDIDRHVTHALGGLVPESLRNGQAAGTPMQSAWIANMAGRHMIEGHQWRFRERPAALLNIVNGQDWAALPADFGELRAIEQTDFRFGRFNMTDATTFLKLKQTQVVTRLDYWGCIFNESPALQTDDLPQAKLYLYPTPNESVNNALTIFYRARWTDLSNAGHKPAIPAFAELLYIDLCRKIALGLVSDSLEQQISLWEASIALASAKAKDGMIQPDLGTMAGGDTMAWFVRENIINPILGP